MSASADPLERAKAGLAAVVGEPVEAVPRGEWRLRPGGEPTVLPGPLTQHLGFRKSPGYVSGVASGDSFAEIPGVHYMREDKDAPPESRTRTYSHVVIEDIVGDDRWPDVLRAAGLTASAELEATARAHVFTYPEYRVDHHSAEVPADIAKAKPREDTA